MADTENVCMKDKNNQSVSGFVRREGVVKNLHAEEFARRGLLRLNDFVNKAAVSKLCGYALGLSNQARRRDLIMPGSGTPRHMSCLGGQKLRESEDYFDIVHRDMELVALLEEISRLSVKPSQHPQECFVVNILHQTGDTHGWHLDDPELALVVVCEQTCKGGKLQVVQWEQEGIVNFDSLIKKNTTIVKTVELHYQDVYLLHASKIIHRISPLQADGNSRRVAVNFAYDKTTTTLDRYTVDLLYGED